MESEHDRVITRIINEVSLPHRILFASVLRETMGLQKEYALKHLAQEKYTHAFAAAHAAQCIGDLMYTLTSAGVLDDTELSPKKG